ncbi:diaminopimelate epimerase [Candidatus Sumerlaeota bacterium]|nr:diaminopimelate epimerase [Candidatus Sumerlaeota bacterium]
MKLAFHKLDGAGNDFVCLDWRGKKPMEHREASKLAVALCNRYHGIGADGLMFLEDPSASGTHFTMHHLNSDGSFAEMCGNGTRCMARYADFIGAAPKKMSFLTGAGVYYADVFDESVSTHFPDVKSLPEERNLIGPLKPFSSATFLLVGVPHAVVFTEDLDLLDVNTIGREMRHDQAFAPAGTNLNFAEEKGGVLHVRTYERGVEAETQACGTGSVATACCYARQKGLSGPVTLPISPTSGIRLAVSLTPTDDGFKDITLSGPGKIVFHGECIIDENFALKGPAG